MGEPTTPGGWTLVRPVLAAHPRRIGMLIAWSLLGVTPVLVSGRILALALDRGFLAGDGLYGAAMLGVYGFVLAVGAFGTRQAIGPVATLVEAVRDHLVHLCVDSGLRQATRSNGPPDASAVSRLVSQTESVRQLLANLLMTASSAGLMLVAALVGLTTLSPLVAATLLPVGVLAALTLRWLMHLWQRRYRIYLVRQEEVSRRTGQVVSAMRDVIANSATRRASGELDRVLHANAEASTAVANLGGVRIGIIVLTARVPLVILLVLAPWLLSGGLLTPGELLGAATYLVSGLQPALRGIVQVVGNMGLELRSVLSRLAEQSHHAEPPSGATRTTAGTDLSMHDVVFRYQGQPDPIFNGVSLDLPARTHIAVVGPSGVGKSTLATLLAGLEAPHDGTIRLGGVQIEQLQPDSVRKAVALIPQQAYVFAGTVRENLTYLAPNARDEEIDSAVAALGATDLVHTHGGYDGMIEQPSALSPGQRQLLVLVRTYLSSSRIVILDEATCHLDLTAEARVESAFVDKGVTLVVIAHRLSSAIRAGRVLLLENGGLRTGSHEHLVAESATYRELASHWYARQPGTCVMCAARS